MSHIFLSEIYFHVVIAREGWKGAARHLCFFKSINGGLSKAEPGTTRRRALALLVCM